MTARERTAAAPLFLVVGGGGSRGHIVDWTRRTAEQAARRGYELVIADLEKDLGQVTTLPAVRATHDVEFRDVRACVELARAVHGERPLAGVVAFREYALLSAAAAADALGLPWNDPDAVRASRTKDLCRERVRAAGLPQPECFVVDTAAAAEKLLADRTGRWIVKPRDAFGSEGVALVTVPGDDVRAPAERAFEFSAAVIVEEFVTGAEYSAEAIIVAGEPHVLAVTRKETTPPPYFVELGHTQPAGLREPVMTTAVDTVERAVRAVGLTHSLLHVEFWVTPSGGVVCGEVHSRTGGDWIHVLTEHGRPGLELFGSVLDDVLGRPVTIPPLDPARTGAIHVVTPPPGRVVEVRGVDRARAMPGCAMVDVIATPGTSVGSLTDSFARGALVVATATAPADASATAREIADAITFVTEPVR